MDATTYDDAAYWLQVERMAAEGDATGRPVTPSWRPLSATVGLSGASLMAGLIMRGASPLDLAFGVILVLVGLIVSGLGWLAMVLVSRKYVHVAELYARDRVALKREAELEKDLTLARTDNIRLVELVARQNRTNEIAVTKAVTTTEAPPRKTV